MIGLALWVAACAAALRVTVLALVRDAAPGATTAAVALGMLMFHVYGVFQGMAYIPVIFFLFHVLLAYCLGLDPGPESPRARAVRRGLLAVLGTLVLLSPLGYFADRGYRSVKRAFGIEAYLPDEIAEFEGFYRPESGPNGEFRWMPRRGIVNVRRAAPFRLTFTCEHPDLEREPVVIALRFQDQDAGSIVCRRPGSQEKRFDPPAAGTLRLEASRTFRPGGADRRELGVAVSAIRWE